MNSSRFNHERAFYLGLVLLGWTLYGFFFASQNYVRQAFDGRNPNFQRDLAVWLTCGYSWAILTYPILLLARRFPFSRDSWHRALAVHIPAAVVFSIATLMIFALIRAMLGHSFSAERFQNLVVENIHSSVLIYFGILAVREVMSYLFGPGTSEARPQQPLQQDPPGARPKLDEAPAAEVVDNPVAEQRKALPYVERFPVKKRGRIVFIEVADINLITSEGNYVKIHSNGGSHLLRDTMKGIELKLDPKDFLRVRRSTIVRTEQIKELRPLPHGEFEIVVKNGAKLSSSRRYRKYLNSLLQREK